MLSNSSEDPSWIWIDHPDIERRRAQLRQFLRAIEREEETAPEGDAVRSEVIGALRKARNKNTNRAYDADQLPYIIACHFEGVDHLAPTPELWEKFFTERSRELGPSGSPRRPSSIQRAGYGIGRLFQEHGLPSPTKTRFHRDLIQKIMDKGTEAPRTARPLWGDDAKRLVDSYGQETLPDLRDGALAALGTNRGPRGDTMVGLQIGDATCDKRGAIIGIRHDKTFKGAEPYYTATKHNKHHVACFPCRLKLYLDALNEIGITEGPIFRGIDRWGRISPKALTAKSVTALLRKGLRNAGVSDPDSYSAHSYRHGVVKTAAHAGWSIEEIMLLTLHRSRRGLAHYIRNIDFWYFAPRSIADSGASHDAFAGSGWIHEIR